MMRDINFSNDNVAVQWQYVKRNLTELGLNEVSLNFEDRIHKVVERFIQEEIDGEFELQIRAGVYEHADDRLDQRKGRYERYLTTTFGTSRIKVPRTRGVIKVRYTLFDRYQRRRKEFDEAVLLSMLLGLSVRKQRKFFERFIGDAVSHTTASRLINNLQDDLDKYRTEPIKDEYKYLLIDGLWVKVMDAHKRLKQKVILFVLGITANNKKGLIAFKLADGETENEVTALLNDIYRRGLKGKHLRLIASDGSKGIKAAIQMVYPYATWQLCSTHKLRNLAGNIRYKIKHRAQIMQEASAIYQASTREEADERFEAFCAKWQTKEPNAINCFKKDFNDTLAYYAHNNDRNFISTTNHIERYLEEIRRRTKIQGYFKNEKSLNLWVYGITSLLREGHKEQLEKLKQPKDMSNYVFALIKEPITESAQLC